MLKILKGQFIDKKISFANHTPLDVNFKRTHLAPIIKTMSKVRASLQASTIMTKCPT